MEQVLAPNFKFKRKLSDDDKAEAGVIKIRGFKEPSSRRVKDIVESDLHELKAAILQNEKILQALPGEFIDPEVINKINPAEIGIVANAKSALKKLINVLEQTNNKRLSIRDEMLTLKQEFEKSSPNLAHRWPT